MSVRSLVVAALAAAIIACQSEAPVVPSASQHQHPVPVPAKGPAEGSAADLSVVRQATAKFHDFDVAYGAGWNSTITSCFFSDSGGMGYHQANLDLFDAVLDPAQPEVLLYEPQKNGKLHLVGVEYIVPRPAWPHPTPPVLYGQVFPYIPEFDVYGLHVWIWRNNPSPQGMFKPWNPAVSCRYAPASR